jgi:hypothetical protein
MFFKDMLGGALRALKAHNENAPNDQGPQKDSPSASNVRALATGAALAVSIDTSPAVLVSIYDYAHRYRDRPRRTA